MQTAARAPSGFEDSTMKSVRVAQRVAVLCGTILAATPAFAQIDLAGEWGSKYTWDVLERLPGPEIGDYTGLPINTAARLKADSWQASVQTVPERQCIPHGPDYLFSRAAFPMRISKIVEPSTQDVVAWHVRNYAWGVERTIWMDGRPHPSRYARHTWEGFSTGKWAGNSLTVSTSHLKWNYLRRNGVPRSDEATLTEHFVRHGDLLTLLSYLDDPVFLEEPMVRTAGYVLNPTQHLEPFLCEPVEEVARPEGVIPHYLPGTNPDLTEFAKRRGLPFEATRGGAASVYPAYMPVLERMLTNPGSKTATDSPSLSRTTQTPSPQRRDSDAGTLELVPVTGSIFMLAGDGGNITLQVGKDGVFIVDAGSAEMSDRALEMIRKLTDKPIRYVANTTMDRDHTGGNEALGRAGSKISGGDQDDDVAGLEKGAQILAHQQLLERMSGLVGHGTPAPFARLPTDTYRGRQKDLFFNGEPILLLHQAAAHTDGDSIVFFRDSEVISTGDVFVTTEYPTIDLERGGSIQGVIDALNRLIELTVPEEHQEGGTLVIPGHGRVCDEADVVEYRDMVTIIRDRIKDMLSRGLTLDQVKAARPTEDYDRRYGTNADQFVEAVYQSLSQRR
jgi:cyclase